MKSRGYGKKIATGLFTVAVACSLSGCGNEDVSDFAGCAKANEYILHGEGTAKEATEALGFRIYCTDEMQALIEWMHEYNMTAGKENQVRFYGFDCQRDMYGIDIINEFYQAADVTKGVDYAKKLQELYGED